MRKNIWLTLFSLLILAKGFAQNGTLPAKTIHIYVALCDNKYQGIVPVPKAIGNGQDPNNNLYWGCANGIRTYFKKSAAWKLLKAEKLKGVMMERLVFKHVSKNYYLVADVYDGQYIKQTTLDFLNSAAGNRKQIIDVNGVKLGIGGTPHWSLTLATMG